MGGYERPVTETHNVTYIRGENLTDWLVRRPQRLSSEDVEAIARHVGG